jgi:long-chain acyl-CoA synthetase
MNIAKLLVRSGKEFADSAAIMEGSIQYASYKELAGRVAVMASNLHTRLDLQPGDRVAIIMNNSPQYIEVMFACWHAGLIVVPVNAKLAAKEFSYILGDSQCKVCFSSNKLYEVIASLKDSIVSIEQIIDVSSEYFLRLGDGEPITPVDRAPTDCAWLFYTSGTTGQPKGAMLSNRALLTMISGFFIDVDHVDSGDSLIHAAPMSHGSGFYVLPYIVAGGKQVIPLSGGFDCEEIYSLISEHKGVSFFAAPTMVHRLINYPSSPDTSNLKSIIYGGGPMYVEDCRKALDIFGNKLIQIYGQGESPMTISVLNRSHHNNSSHPRYDQRLASVGIPQALVEVKVVAADGKTVAAGDIGEILVRGDILMSGYWGNDKATADSIRDGWLYTGDLGSLDTDGYLTLKDRSKDLIISGGSNIYPREVEEVLLQHSEIDEVSVIGCPDSEWGEVVVAFVVKKQGRDVSEEELDEWCLDSLARFKRPRYYKVVDQLPKNNYGKVLKSALREML